LEFRETLFVVPPLGGTTNPDLQNVLNEELAALGTVPCAGVRRARPREKTPHFTHQIAVCSSAFSESA